MESEYSLLLLCCFVGWQTSTCGHSYNEYPRKQFIMLSMGQVGTRICRCLSEALLVARCLSLVRLVVFSGNNRTTAPVTLPIEEVLQTLQDLIAYFQPPEEEMQHEDKQNKLRSLKNRQNLFKEEVSLKTIELRLSLCQS